MKEQAEIQGKLEELPGSKKFLKKKKVVEEALALNEKNIRTQMRSSRSMAPVYRWLQHSLFNQMMS